MSDRTQVPSRDTSPFTKWSRRRCPSDSSTWSGNTRLQKQESKRTRLLKWLPHIIIIWLQGCILVVLLWMSVDSGRSKPPATHVETGGDINGLYKDSMYYLRIYACSTIRKLTITVSHSYVHLKPDADKFVPNMTSNQNRMEIRQNWDLLMPRMLGTLLNQHTIYLTLFIVGSGSIAIPDYTSHPLLGSPIVDDPIRSGPLFEASWTHALHCLYYTLDSYHQLLLLYQDPTYNISTYHTNGYHATHCFEYLRNNILCNLDMTLEGDQSLPDEKERGQPHVCRNYDEAVKWIEERRVDDFQDIVGP